jgi:hypothetical protein
MSEPDENERRHTTLTDEDVKRIADAIIDRQQEQLTQWAGRGVIGFLKKGLFLLILLMAIYGASGMGGLFSSHIINAPGK